jgi:RNA 3'-terminal phosphate cyclase
MDVLIIDESQGEGGGPILKTALSLSIVATRAFLLVNIARAEATPDCCRSICWPWY